MSRSQAMRNLRRTLRLALHCARTGMPAREALDQLHDHAVDLGRRRALGAAAAAVSAALLPDPLRSRAWAAPAVQGGVAIVGGGLAALSCAYQLAGKRVRATVYEAGTRVGGRCWSLYEFFPGQVAERGGEFIDTTHTTMRGYANAFGLTMEDVTGEPGEVTYYFDGRSWDEAQVVEEFRAFVPAMQDDLRQLGAPTAQSFTEYDRKLDFTTLADYLAARGAGPLIRQVIDVAYTIEYGLDISRQSALAFLFFIHADRRAKFRPFGVFSDERFHVVEGNEAIVRGLADALAGQIELGHQLMAARKLSDGRVGLTFSVAGRSVTTEHDAVVFAIPFSTLRDVRLDASLGLPAWKRFAIDNLAYGTNSKMMVGFDARPWYTLHGSNGSSYSDLPNHQSTWETNPIRATAASAILTDYSGGARGARLDPARVQTEAALFLGDLDRVYPGAASAATLLPRNRYRVHLDNWLRNPLAKGSYTCNQPGYFTTIADNEARPVDNLFFAGEHTSSFYEWQGFMEGAALSGVRAAGEALALLRGK
jgi:monoamine oxidase